MQQNKEPRQPVRGPEFKNCIRCGVRCRTVTKKNPDANVFVRGDMQTGRFCTNCLVTDFFKNFDLGPAGSLGPEYFDSFNPEGLRLPHIQQQFAAVVMAAKRSYGAELFADEIDWDEVIANWHLPFPETRRGKKGGRK